MWFVLCTIYDFLPKKANSVGPREFEDEYLAKTGNLGAIYFDWLCSFEEDFEPGMGYRYRVEKRKLFVNEMLKRPDLEDLLFFLTKEMD